jgi:hypothetical protein
MYLSHFDHGLLEMILQMLIQFHASRGSLMDLEVFHISQGTSHIIRGTFGLFPHAWVSY